MSDLEILIAEMEAYEKSLNFNMAGYSQVLPDGTEHFCCQICGHSPKLLLERLKRIQAELTDMPPTNSDKQTKDTPMRPERL